MTGLLKAAINGGRTLAEHPGIPVTPEQQALVAAESVSAGAAAIHLHVRGPDGSESLTATDVAAALTAIRAAVPGIPIGVSTGAWIIRDTESRLKAIAGWTLLPDFASVNFHEEGSKQLAELLRTRGVGVEAGLANTRGAEVLVDSGLAARCLRVMFEPQEGDADTALGMLAQLEARLDGAGIRLPRLLHGVGPTAWPLIDAAIARGYDTRVGFEDTLTLPDGTTAPGNAALVAAARGRIEARGAS